MGMGNMGSLWEAAVFVWGIHARPPPAKKGVSVLASEFKGHRVKTTPLCKRTKRPAKAVNEGLSNAYIKNDKLRLCCDS